MIDIKILDLDDEDDKFFYKLQNQAKEMHCFLHDINEIFYKNDKLLKEKYLELKEYYGDNINFDF